jgi:hypothetical protein
MAAPEAKSHRPLGVSGWMGELLEQLDDAQTPRA